MAPVNRSFEHKSAVRAQTPLLVGLVGSSSSGKTYSALRLAVGIQRVVGGEIFFIDTEARRALHYADKFKFQHIDFQPPFGPLDYLAAIEHCVANGAKTIIIDSLTHEHSGPGGVMDQSETFLEKKCGDDWKARERMLMISLVRPKTQRKRLNARIVQLGINAVFCYRAMEKIKPVTGGEPIKLGWQPETTSTLYYDMTKTFILPPGSDGIPLDAKEELDAERRLSKSPEQFRGWFKDGEQLSEDLGERMAKWCAGVQVSGASAPTPNGARPQAQQPTGPVFARTWKSEWAGKPLDSAPAVVLAEYISGMEKVLADDSKSAVHTTVRAAMERAQDVYVAVLAEEAIAAQ